MKGRTGYPSLKNVGELTYYVPVSVTDPPEGVWKDASIEGFSQGLSKYLIQYLESPMPCRICIPGAHIFQSPSVKVGSLAAIWTVSFCVRGRLRLQHPLVYRLMSLQALNAAV